MLATKKVCKNGCAKKYHSKNMCVSCYNKDYATKNKEKAAAKQRERRRLNGNKITKKYEKTIGGFLMRTYRNMKSRVTGIQKKKAHLYLGLPIMDKNEFYAWSKADEHFINLFNLWVKSNYDRKITPSIDRIDSDRGYIKGNVRWITPSQNSKLGSQSRYSQQMCISI